MMRCIELITRAKKLLNVYSFIEHVKSSPSHVQNAHTSTTSPVNQTQECIKTKVLVKFGASMVNCVELRVKNLPNVYSL